MLYDFLQVIEHQPEYRLQRLQLLVPQEVVVSWSTLWSMGLIELALFCCFRCGHIGEIGSFSPIRTVDARRKKIQVQRQICSIGNKFRLLTGVDFRYTRRFCLTPVGR